MPFGFHRVPGVRYFQTKPHVFQTYHFSVGLHDNLFEDVLNWSFDLKEHPVCRCKPEILWMEEILNHLEWLKSDLSTGAGFFSSTVGALSVYTVPYNFCMLVCVDR